MYKDCTSKPAIARQREIEEGLLDYMSHKAYEDITVIELCQKLDIPRKAFYRYFTNKDGALFALIDHTLQGLASNYLDSKPNFASITETMEHFFEYWLKKKKLLDALAANNLSGVLLQRAVNSTIENESLFNLIVLSQGSVRAKKYKTNFIISGIISLVIQWHHNHFDKTPAQMAKLAVELLPQ